ncbi:MAG TPA: asparaginase [Rhizomicrobium sp.]|nr:asparaginase [Rhizomicrobium sp.]
MANPILVEITRGALVESVHRGALAIANARGEIVFSLGDIEAVSFPRSSLKMVQALPLVESGAADAFGLSSEEIALACASHSGEPMHTTRVAKWLERIGCTEHDLACGAHPSRVEAVNDEMIRKGEKPTRIFNNCSGKHTGFLTVCRHWDVATSGYELHDHPLQAAIARALGELAGIRGEIPYGIDGCVAPAFALPVSSFARVLAQFADPSGQPLQRAAAMKRIVAAMIAHPDLVAGTGRSDTILMRAANNRIATKAGAEAYYAAIVPEAGLGIALKIDDGTGRAAETAIAAILDKLGVLTGDKAAHEIIRAPIPNTRGKTVGERRPAKALAEAAIRAI